MQDRLRDLQKLRADSQAKGKGTDSDESDHAIEMKDLEDAEEEFMNDFFADVAQVKKALKKMEKNIEALEKEYQEQLHKIAGSDKKAQQMVVDGLIDDISATAREIQALLKKMADRTEREQADVGPAESRIRKNLHTTLITKFTDTMQIYQEIQAKYRQQFKEMAKKQMKIANPSATDEQVEEAIESGDTDRIFADQSLQRHKQALNYVKDKYREIIKIEQSLTELYQMFVDMATLVAEQSEMINQIEHNIEKAHAYTKEAVVELKQANKHAARSRRTMCILVIIIVVVLVIAGVVVGTTVSFLA